MSDERRPAIICFHGHGSNGTIFQHQAQNLVHILGTRFRFLFIDSPITTPQPGVGVRPFFADVKPYRRWHQDEKTVGLFDVTTEEIERERRLVRDTIGAVFDREQRNGPGVVGVMGFSQGTRVATALCLDPGLAAHIKFAIMICGIGPSLPLTAEPLSPTLDFLSIHVQGNADPWAARGARLSREYFNQKFAKTVKFIGGHEVPTRIKDVEKIAREIMVVYDSAPAFMVTNQVVPSPLSV
ncbi:putative oxidoreductase [Aspergillus clavatus NRRL 1]|uniref:Serine hydrolase domain-containing protein n=1 Tax=Aspergillus clavatus (strain ATCC 1007 / CBS 513.65 / DSM 816 / NCTC 3887 / NRRL 1 / QM 1276 / 107) TaxID=344612 RepID=A1CN09_ASPCL|nr:uncharacterized protein ACLA_098880 [Aspergillus clavatus NRRL 1]EAW08946.1 conserved hypothetical protein [Aspergillus clavatus NRRL 1]